MAGSGNTVCQALHANAPRAIVGHLHRAFARDNPCNSQTRHNLIADSMGISTCTGSIRAVDTLLVATLRKKTSGRTPTLTRGVALFFGDTK